MLLMLLRIKTKTLLVNNLILNMLIGTNDSALVRTIGRANQIKFEITFSRTLSLKTNIYRDLNKFWRWKEF